MFLTACRACCLQVGFCPDLALQGGTPSYLLPLLTFNHLMQVCCGFATNPSAHAMSARVAVCCALHQLATPAHLPTHPIPTCLQLWQEVHPAKRISVDSLHGHVMRLHESFLRRLDAAGHPAINTRTLLPPQVRVERADLSRMV